MMPVRRYRTNLTCASCVAKVTPFLNGDLQIARWSVDTTAADKTLTIEGHEVPQEQVARHLAAAGFKLLGPLDASEPTANLPADSRTFLQTYQPLLLVLGYLLGIVAVIEFSSPAFDSLRAMGNFMGGFFLAFSFFKLLDLPGFANAFQTYDILAHRLLLYGYIYPFIELGLGVAYLARWSPWTTNLATLIVMFIGILGVTEAVLAKRKIQCACLGTGFNLPMSQVTIIEDAVMAVMALVMLLLM